MKRNEFLKVAAAGTAALVVGLPLGAQSITIDTTNNGYGIVGCEGIFTRVYQGYTRAYYSGEKIDSYDLDTNDPFYIRIDNGNSDPQYGDVYVSCYYASHAGENDEGWVELSESNVEFGPFWAYSGGYLFVYLQTGI